MVRLDITRKLPDFIQQSKLPFDSMIHPKKDENNRLPQYADKKLLETSLDEFIFSARVSNALSRHELRTVGDVLSFGWHKIYRIKNIGNKSVNELKNTIEHFLQESQTEKSRIEEKQNTFFDKEDDKIYFSVIEDIFSSFLTEKQLQIVKARYGYEDGKKKTLEEIGNGLGITRERVRQIIVNSLSRLKHPAIIYFLQVILENIESVLLYNQGVIGVNDLLSNDFFTTGNKNQLKFLLNLLEDLYEERYRIIEKKYFTSLNDEELKKFHSVIDEAALKCHFPINKEKFFQEIITTTGHVSKHYLSYYLIQKKRVAILKGNVLSPGRLSVPQKVKFIMRNINKPLHFTEIAKHYKNYFGDLTTRALNLERAIHGRIGDSEDFIIVGPGTFMLRDKFKVPDNIKEIVNISKEILQNLKDISDTKYLIKELQRRGINVGDLNEYSLKPILLDYPEFVRYGKFEIGIKKLSTEYDKKSLSDLMHDVLLTAGTPLHSKKIWEQISKQRGFPRYAIDQRLSDEPKFIKIAPSTYTVKDHIASYAEKRKIIIDFTKEWINLKGHAVSAFFVNEVMKATEEIKDLTIGIVEHVLATSSEFVKLPNRFYDLANKLESTEFLFCTNITPCF